jgi:hypothetical protein
MARPTTLLALVVPAGIYETEVASRELELVFHNPFVGKACMLCSGDLPAPSILLHHATADLDSARVTGRSLRFPGEVDAAVRLSGPERDKVQPSCEAALEWGSDLLLAVAHVTTLRTLCDYGATPDLAAGPLGETPLMIAAAWGNAAVTAALLLGGADPELTRWAAGWAYSHSAQPHSRVICDMCWGARHSSFCLTRLAACPLLCM